MSWYFQVMGEVRGPVSGADLKALAAEGTLTVDSLVRKDEDGNWTPASHVRGLFAVASPASDEGRHVDIAQCFEEEQRSALPAEPSSLKADKRETAGDTTDAGREHQTWARPGPTVVDNRSPVGLFSAWMPLAMSASALLISLMALGTTWFSKPLGKGMRGYDFATPEAACKSMLQIDAERDVLAHLDIERLDQGGNPKDVLRTFEVNRTADFADKKLIFVSYMHKGKKIRRYFGFEKNLEAKLWVPRYVSPTDVLKTNEQLGKDLEAWEKEEK